MRVNVYGNARIFRYNAYIPVTLSYTVIRDVKSRGKCQMDTIELIALLAVMAVLLALSAFFSASETAYTGMSRTRLKSMDPDGTDKRIQRALKNADDFDRLLTTILVGNNIVNIASSTICTFLMCELLMNDFWGTVAATVLMITLLLILGEITPKTWAKKNPERVAIGMSGPVSVAIRILKHITSLFLKVTHGVTRVTGAEESDPAITEEELGIMIDEIQQEGTLEKRESELAKAALEFDDIRVGEICVPRVDMVTVSLTADAETLKNLFVVTEFSRIPVYEGTVDRIIGAVFFKDFFMKYTTKKTVRIADILRPVRFVPQEMSISSVMSDLENIGALDILLEPVPWILARFGMEWLVVGDAVLVRITTGDDGSMHRIGNRRIHGPYGPHFAVLVAEIPAKIRQRLQIRNILAHHCVERTHNQSGTHNLLLPSYDSRRPGRLPACANA